jgi:hypothetical protein
MNMVTIKFKSNGEVKEGKVDTHTLNHINAHSHIEVIIGGVMQLVAVANIIVNH